MRKTKPETLKGVFYVIVMLAASQACVIKPSKSKVDSGGGPGGWDGSAAPIDGATAADVLLPSGGLDVGTTDIAMTGDLSSDLATAGAGGSSDAAGTGGANGGAGGRGTGGAGGLAGADASVTTGGRGGDGGGMGTGGAVGTGGSTGPAPTILSFVASPPSIKKGSSSTLTWEVTGATSLSIDQGIGVVTGTTSKVVTPAETTTYFLTAQNAAGVTAQAKASVVVVSAPSITSFTASPATVAAGGATTLTAVFVGGQASIDQGVGEVTSGAAVRIRSVTAPTTYTLTVTNALGESTTATVTVGVIGFVATGSTTANRQYHAAALLANGKVLVVGGTDAESIEATAELYDPVAGTFTATSPMSTARHSPTATTLSNGRVLVAGGKGSSGSLPIAEVYDPVSGTFALTGSMITARLAHKATLLPNGKVLIAGGYSTLTSTNVGAAELYDPATGTFSPAGTMSGGLDTNAMTVLANGNVLFTGGYDVANELTAKAELYDVALGAFTALGPMNVARASHTATLLPNGKVLLAGGFDGSSTIESVELYDPSTGTSLIAKPLKYARHNHTGTLLGDGKLLIAGGAAMTSVTFALLGSAELYDPIVGTFSDAGMMILPREMHSATALSDRRVLFVGGGVTTSAELYYY